jgi:hypothetical protein
MQVDIVSSALPSGAATAANQLPDGHNVTIDNASGASAVNIQDGGNSITVDGTVTANAGTGTFTVDLGSNNDVQGPAAHDAASSGNPFNMGAEAIAHGSNPTAVAAADATKLYANRHGIPFMIGGHMNVVSREYVATTAQTNDAIITVGSGTKIVVTEIEAMVDNATSVDVGVRVGFGTASVPTEPADGATVDDVILSHPGIAPGSGVIRGTGAGIIGMGGDNEDLRITSEVPTDGRLRVLVSYYTIES